ncbi:hypothetical protein [Hymenobacter properus]|uniref:Uncharacterized protein n=1 Tax=Hymenobacter properus TaxID=2791026 RepID=A0A931FL85_9BACT|nr:hypothetical protein [Hymenobacter properus]MBF9140459.1 hypothetical protein [Hymenobacter properus]MBR7719266.1 hypothetical protein [Microvirga sp. SRT04]
MKLTEALRRCLFPERAFRWYSRLPPADLQGRLQAVNPLPAVQPSFRRIGAGDNELYLWLEMDDARFKMVARRLVPDTSPELRITGSVRANGQGSIMAGTVQWDLTRRITWLIFRFVVLLSATSWLLKSLATQSGRHHWDALALIGWIAAVSAVAAAPFVEFSLLCGNLLPKVQGRFLAIDCPLKRELVLPK